VLSTLAVDVVSTADVMFSKEPRLEQRGTAIAVLAKQGARFAVAGVHLDLQPAARGRHAYELESALRARVPDGTPTVVGGDVNDGPGSPAWSALSARRADCFAVAGEGGGFTFSARDPRKRIDGIFADPAFVVWSACVLDHPDVLAASDHRPLVVELEL
jgi:endonuclease/exonuclease/phosphatase family metal-dependent hydrolase